MAASVLVIGAVAAVLGARGWIDAVLHQPLDPYRGDMLVVIRESLHRLALGHDPYGLYHIPWEAPLPYGPALWMPFAIPAALGADIRVVTIVGQLFPTAVVVIGASVLAGQRRVVGAAAALAIAFFWVLNPDVGRFVTIGHTPAYWPLIPLVAWFVAEERWTAAAVTLGLLCVARTTMVSIVPVFAMAVWRRDRGRIVYVLVALVTTIAISFMPFAIWNWSMLEYGLYGSYQNVMKGFVWTSTDWVQHSLGVTGFLLRAHLPRLVEPVQIAALLVTYAAAWRALARGAMPVGWMAISLCVFSMTTLWPVTYVYFDVALLMSSAALFAFPVVRGRLTPAMLACVLGVVVIGVVTGMRVAAPPDVSIDVGDARARRDLPSGFSTDEREGDRSFAWVDGREATLLIPRFSRAPATIAIDVAPAVVRGGPPQQMTVVLNGTTLGTRNLVVGWQQVRFDAPARTLTAGVNELRLYFQVATSPREAGTGDDPRQLSAAIDLVRVYSSARLVPAS